MNFNFIGILFVCFLLLSVILKLFLDILNYSHRSKFKDYIPDDLKGYVDEQKLVKINLYSNEKLKFSLFEYFFDNLFLLFIIFLGLIPWYYNLLSQFTDNIYIICLFFFGGYFLVNFTIGLPFSFYFNFRIEKKFDFNKMTINTWIVDKIKELILSAIFGVIILLPLIFFLYTFTNFWFLLLWFFLLMFSLFIQVLYPTVIAPLFNKFEPLKSEELRIKIEKLLKECGFEYSGLFEMDASRRSTHGNAYFTGFGKSKRIVLFDTLLKNHTDDEILAILSHELGHFKYKHILKNLILSSVFSLLALYISYLFIDYKVLYEAFGFTQNIKIIGLFLLSILFTPVSFFFSPVSAFFSRKNEYQADNYSKQIMKDSTPLVNALKKLNVDNLSNLYPHPIYSWFYYSHPPLLDRIKALNSKK